MELVTVESQQTWSMSSPEKRQKKMSLLSLLFFMLGALNIYVYLQKAKRRFDSDIALLLRVGLLAASVAGLLEVYSAFALPVQFSQN
jgi:hypothetical protein